MSKEFVGKFSKSIDDQGIFGYIKTENDSSRDIITLSVEADKIDKVLKVVEAVSKPVKDTKTKR